MIAAEWNLNRISLSMISVNVHDGWSIYLFDINRWNGYFYCLGKLTSYEQTWSKNWGIFFKHFCHRYLLSCGFYRTMSTCLEKKVEIQYTRLALIWFGGFPEHHIILRDHFCNFSTVISILLILKFSFIHFTMVQFFYEDE